MVLDNNIITTYSSRKALCIYREEATWKDSVFIWTAQSPWSLASLWNPWILNVHKIINLDTNVSYTYKLRFNLLLKSLALKKTRAAKIWPTKFRRWEELGFKYFLLILYFSSLCRTSTDMKSSSLCGSESKIFAQLWLLWYSAVNTSAIVCFKIC